MSASSFSPEIPRSTLISDVLPDLLPMQNRSPGIHVSDVITYLCQELGYFKKMARSEQSEVLEAHEDYTWMQLGCALEDAIAARFEEHYPGRFARVGEQELDGLFLTPDLLDVIDMIDTEIKLAWMSSRQSPDGPKFWRYWVQVMAYCHVLELRRGRLIVVHIAGNWADDISPKAHTWERRFTRRELQQNWDMILTAANSHEFSKWLHDNVSTARMVGINKAAADRKRHMAAKAKKAGATVRRTP